MTATTLLPIAHILGWTLLHFCWQGTLIALSLYAALSLLRNSSATLRYAVCCGAMLLALVVMLMTMFHMAAGMERDSQEATTLLRAPDQVVDLLGWPGGSGWKTRFEQSLPVLSVLWCAGVCVCLLRLGFGLSGAWWIASRASVLQQADLSQSFLKVAEALGVRRAVRLLTSAQVQVPTVIGWLRPVVLMPAGVLAGLTTQQMEAVFAHELAHIRRHDYLVNILQLCAEALLFFHPGIWWISRQVRQYREICCDDIAAEFIGERAAYARALYLLAERGFATPAVTLSTNGGFLTMRIQRLLHPTQNQQGAAAPALALLLITAAALAGTAKAQLGQHIAAQPAVAAAVLHRQITTIDPLPVNASHPLLASVAVPVAPEFAANSFAGDAEEKRLQIEGGKMAGNIRNKVAPVYPAEARAQGIQGSVVLKAIISKEGDVSNLQVVSGPKELLNSAVDAVRQWKYAPYLLNGQPTEVETTITVNYHLGS